MDPKEKDQNVESGDIGFRFRLGAALLGLYVALYLAVGAMIHLFMPPDATAAVSTASSAPPAATATEFSGVTVGKSSAGGDAYP
jgi:hypothetical protein